MAKELNITKLIETYQNGDHLTDRELNALVQYFEKLYTTTMSLPAEFALFRKEIQRMFFQLESHSNSRNVNKQ